MKLYDLNPLDTFELGDVNYEVIEVYPGGRIALCFELDAAGEYIPREDNGEFKTRLISDIRYNDRYATPEDELL